MTRLRAKHICNMKPIPMALAVVREGDTIKQAVRHMEIYIFVPTFNCRRTPVSALIPKND